jgi:hypothetical protein
VLYYTQIGYYALDVDESVESRIPLTSGYFEVFTGRKPSSQALAKFNAYAKSIAAKQRGRRRSAKPSA